jgi:hypothetical protein
LNQFNSLFDSTIQGIHNLVKSKPGFHLFPGIFRREVLRVRMRSIRPRRAVPGRAAAAKRCPLAERNLPFRPMNGRRQARPVAQDRRGITLQISGFSPEKFDF